MRRLLYAVAQRVSMPVYKIEKEMPAHELAEWLQVFAEEQSAREPPGIESVGVESMAAGLGVPIHGS